MNVSQWTVDRSEMTDKAVHQLRHLVVVGWHLAEFCIAQFDGVDVIGALLGIDDEYPLAWVAVGLPCEVSGGQLPLAGATQWIGIGVVGYERLRLRQSFGHRAGDAGEVADLRRIEPYA